MPIPRKPITPKTPLEARKAFKINGRPIKPGDPFDWRRMSVSWHRARILYEGGFVVVREDDSQTSLVLSDLEQMYIDELSQEEQEAFFAMGIEDQIAELDRLMNDQEPPQTPEGDGQPDGQEGTDEQPSGESDGQSEPDEPSEPATPSTAEVVHQGGGWYDVMADGKAINESKLRKADAEKLADGHNADASLLS